MLTCEPCWENGSSITKTKELVALFKPHCCSLWACLIRGAQHSSTVAYAWHSHASLQVSEGFLKQPRCWEAQSPPVPRVGPRHAKWAPFCLLPGEWRLSRVHMPLVTCETLARVITLGKCLAGNRTVGTEEKSVVSYGWAARGCQPLCPWLVCTCYSTQQKFQVLISSAQWDKEENSGIWERFRLWGDGKTCLRKICCMQATAMGNCHPFSCVSGNIRAVSPVVQVYNFKTLNSVHFHRAGLAQQLPGWFNWA